MADLAKYGEVKHLRSDGSSNGTEEVNHCLRNGWELIAIPKVLEVQYYGNRGDINKKVEVHYELGKRRDYKTPEQIKKEREERERDLEQR